MKFFSYRFIAKNIQIDTDEGKILLSPVRDEILRVRFTRQQHFSDRPSYSVVSNDASSQFRVITNDKIIKISTPKISVVVDKRSCVFSYYDASGKLLVKEPSTGGKQLEAFTLKKTEFQGDRTAKIRSGADGIRADVSGTEVDDRTAWHYRLGFKFDGKEAIYGLGSHEEGLMNMRGHHQYLYQENLKAVVPVLLSTNGYGFFFDNYSYMTFHDDIYGSYIWADVADEMDYYFIYGPEFDEIVHDYRILTGSCPMLPKSSFGYIQSKERYKDQKEILETAKEYRRRNVPLDMIVLDWKSWTGDFWGQKEFDSSRFPDPKAMIDELHRMGVQFMISIWPVMNAGGTNHDEMARAGGILANNITYNAFDEKARSIYWRQAKDGLFQHGVDAWWCDCTEPFESDWSGEVKPEPERRAIINTSTAKKYIDPAEINAYSLLHSKGIYEGQRSCTDEKRVVNLTRSSFAGQHRYATITWSGDISASWDTLKKQIPSGLNFCATGEPYWTLDIGGFFVKRDPKLWFWNGAFDAGCEDLGYRELYVRFLQLGAFLPIFRSHGTDTPREIWNFGKSGEIFYDAILKCIRLRYRLLPYIYSVAGNISLKDGTILRMLPFDFRSDSHTYDIDDEYMFGPCLLVCPVTEPMYYRADSEPVGRRDYTRSVYLPQNCGWFDFWSGKYYEGGTTFRAAAEIDSIPLFIKAGSILPVGTDAQNSEKSRLEQILIYPGANASFTLYEDTGNGYGYERGEYTLTELSWNEMEQTLTIYSKIGITAQKRKLTISLEAGEQKKMIKEIDYTGNLVVVKF